ncbi:MAG: winged helix-turn-helix domain-containing protein [Oliverpabstia sp.]
MKVIEKCGLTINYSEHTVKCCGKEIYFTNREFQVLYLLLQYSGQVLSKQQIYEHVTGDGDRVDYHTIEITISRIRKKLEVLSGRKDYIFTIRGRGYKIK